MLGDLIYQHTGKVTSIRVLDTEKSKMEATVIASRKLKDIGNVNTTITYWNIRSPDGALYGEGQGVITVKDSGNEMAAASAKVKEYGVGKYSSSRQQHHQQQQTIWRGSAFYQSYSSSTDSKISFLNNIVGVFETDVDDNAGNVSQKVWEWK
jgi:hypothetical protein